jgi:membrane protein DedA with SNARE-associated domain
MGFINTKFWIYNILASTLWAMTFISIGIFFAEHYEIIIKYIGYFMLLILFAVGLYMWKYRKETLIAYWHEKNIEMEARYNKAK